MHPSPRLQRFVGRRVLGAAVRAVQHEREVARRLRRHSHPLPHRCEAGLPLVWAGLAPARSWSDQAEHPAQLGRTPGRVPGDPPLIFRAPAPPVPPPFAGAVADTVFLTLHDWLGPAVFLMYAALAAAAGLYVAAVVPETKGRSLQEVQALLALRCAPGSRRRGWWPPRRGGREEQRAGLLPVGAVLSDASGGGQEGSRVELSQNP